MSMYEYMYSNIEFVHYYFFSFLIAREDCIRSSIFAGSQERTLCDQVHRRRKWTSRFACFPQYIVTLPLVQVERSDSKSENNTVVRYTVYGYLYKVHYLKYSLWLQVYVYYCKTPLQNHLQLSTLIKDALFNWVNF